MWHQSTISIPDVSRLSDDDLAHLFPDCDGKWSPTVRAAVRRLGATGLDLNRTWAETRQDWSCPACGRSKSDIVRVSDAGILLAKLDIHHDHLGDYVKGTLRSRFGPAWGKEGSGAPPGAARAEEVAERLLIRFPWTALCIDCNGADAAVKRANNGIDEYFSFSPLEIASFVSARPNASHDVDHAKAEQIWTQCAPNFHRLKKLADTILAAIVSGDLAACRGMAPARQGFFEDGAHRLLARYAGPNILSAAGQTGEAILARSMSSDGVNSKKPRSPTVPMSPPTDQEYAAYDCGGSPTTWALADAAWRCPVCNRTKREILRPGKASRRWVGRLHKFRDFDFERNEDGDIVAVNGHKDFLVCSGCSEVIAELKSKVPELRHVEHVLPSSDLADFILPTPHSRHEVDWPALVERARTFVVPQAIFDEYWKNYVEPLDF